MGKKIRTHGREDIWLHGFSETEKYFNQHRKEKDISTLLDN